MTNAIAKAILNRKNTLSTLVIPSDLKQEIGPTGYQEACNAGWLKPDLETGTMSITNEAGLLRDIKALAEDLPPDPQIGDTAVVSANGDSFEGSVSKVNPDGTVSLTFSGRKPEGKEIFKKDELRVVRKMVPNNGPQRPGQPQTVAIQPRNPAPVGWTPAPGQY